MSSTEEASWLTHVLISRIETTNSYRLIQRGDVYQSLHFTYRDMKGKKDEKFGRFDEYEMPQNFIYKSIQK